MRKFYFLLFLSFVVFATCIVTGFVFSRNTELDKQINQHKDKLQKQQKELSELKHVLELKSQQVQSAKQKLITLQATNDSLKSSLQYAQRKPRQRQHERPNQYAEEPETVYIDQRQIEAPEIRSRVFFRGRCLLCD